MLPSRVIGVDAHKDTFTFVVLDQGSVVAGPNRRPSTPDEIRNVARKYPGFQIIVEAVGPHEWMHDVWRSEDANVFVCSPPKQAKRGEKNDRNDALLIARRRLSGELKRIYIPTPEMRLLRSLSRERTFLVNRRTQFINHLKHDLNRNNLYHLTIADHQTEIIHHLPHLRSHFAILPALDREIKSLDNEINQHAKTNETVQKLLSIPGIGNTIAFAIYTEIGDIARFPTPESLVKYLGLDPIWKQSGDSLVDLHTISKQGRTKLRSLLVQAAWVHIRCAPQSHLAQKYRELAKRKQNKGLAITSIARRLAETIHRIWRENQPFTLIRPALTEP